MRSVCWRSNLCVSCGVRERERECWGKCFVGGEAPVMVPLGGPPSLPQCGFGCVPDNTRVLTSSSSLSLSHTPTPAALALHYTSVLHWAGCVPPRGPIVTRWVRQAEGQVAPRLLHPDTPILRCGPLFLPGPSHTARTVDLSTVHSRTPQPYQPEALR